MSLHCQLHDDDVADRWRLPSLVERAHQLRVFLDSYDLETDVRDGFIQRMIDVAVLSCAHEAIEAGVAPGMTSSDALWGLAWRARSADWIRRHRDQLQEAIE